MQIEEIRPEDPMEPQKFSVEVVNKCIASFKYNISTVQEKICKRIVDTCGKRNLNFVASHPDPAESLEEKIRSSALCDAIKMNIARSDNLKGHAETLLNLYSTNTNILLGYKQDFVTAGTWQNEEAKLRAGYLNDFTILNNLVNKIHNKEDGLAVIRQKIGDTTEKLISLWNDWEVQIKIVIDLTVAL